ncbi:MAG: hypothetical protein IT452_07880 [Planctomycetia bacterium]|nr:hypothetical protein [Planctomycetia bacterium]
MKATGAWRWFQGRGLQVEDEGPDPLFECPEGGPVTTVRMKMEIWG